MLQIEDKSLVEIALEQIGKRNKEKGREHQKTETQGPVRITGVPVGSGRFLLRQRLVVS